MANNAVYLGVGEYLTAVSPIDPTEDFAVAAWVRIEGDTLNGYNLLWRLMEAASPSAANYFSLWSAEESYRQFLGWTGSGGYRADPEILEDTWYHVIISWASGPSRMVLTLDGEYQGFAGVGAGVNPALDRVVMGNDTGSDRTPVSIRCLRTFNKVFGEFEETDALAEMMSTTPVDTGACTGAWNLNGPSDLTDTVASHNFTATGSPDSTDGPPPFDEAGTEANPIAKGAGKLQATCVYGRDAAPIAKGRGKLAATCVYGRDAAPVAKGRGKGQQTAVYGQSAAVVCKGRGKAQGVTQHDATGATVCKGRGSLVAAPGVPGSVAAPITTGRGNTQATATHASTAAPSTRGRGGAISACVQTPYANTAAKGRGKLAATCVYGRSAGVLTRGRGGARQACARASSAATTTRGRGKGQHGMARASTASTTGKGRGLAQIIATHAISVSVRTTGRGLIIVRGDATNADARATGRGGCRFTMAKVFTGAHSLSLAALVAAYRSREVANAAGVTFATWSSAIAPRVYDDTQGYIGGRHRGRLPFVEIQKASELYRMRASDLGNHNTQWAVIVHVGGLDDVAAEIVARNVLAVGLAVLRATPYAWLGNATAGAFDKDTLGYRLSAVVELRHTYAPANHNVVTG